uniref:U55-Deinotoxin-Dsu1a_1 n=1 Tax=Deinopis subrufa TaxID=1905329 RepID=A0A4Q8KDG5_DEISU
MKLQLLLVLATVLVSVSSDTTCQRHRRTSGNSRSPLSWDILCDDDGMYLPMQCTVQTPKWCACYNKEEAITSPSRKTKSCECHLKKDEALKNSASGPCDVPECEKSGKFMKRQCCGNTCHCVDPDTGVRKSDATGDSRLRCP